MNKFISLLPLILVSVNAYAGNGSFCNGHKTIDYSCGYGKPIGTGWGYSGANCYMRDTGQECGQNFCNLKDGQETAYRCNEGNPGPDWVPTGSGCYQKLTGETCSAPSVSLLADPGLTNPNFNFKNDQAKIIPGTTQLLDSSTPSGWNVSQFSRTDLMQPGVMLTAPEINDPVFGQALYAFPSVNPEGVQTNLSHLWIFKDNSTNNLVYELFEQGGFLKAGGGSNVFLSTGVSDPVNATLDKKISLSFSARVSQSQTVYDTPSSKEHGAVLSQFFTGMTLHYQDPDTAKGTDIFLQIPHGNSNNGHGVTDASCLMSSATQGLPNSGGMLFSTILPSDTVFTIPESSTLQSYSTPMQAVNIDVNQYACALIRFKYPCNAGGEWISYNFPAAAYDLANWTVKSIYIGEETESALADSTGKASGPSQGVAALGVQIENLNLLSYPDSAPSTGTICAH